MEIPWAARETPEERRPALDARAKTILAVICLCAGAAPLAARSIPGELERLSYGLLVSALYLGFTLYARRQPSLREFWQLSFAFFILAAVQVLNNSIPIYFGTYILHQPPTPGNPLASTISGSVAVQLLDTLIAIVPIVVLTKAAGLDLRSVYARFGKFGRAYAIAIVSFVAIYITIGLLPFHRLLPIHGTMTWPHYLSLSPALLVLVFSNGFQEEFLFRGLFLRRYSAFLGVYAGNVVQTLVFAFAHAGVTYTPAALLFILVAVVPLGLIAGYLMRSSDGVVAPAIFHAGVDIPIYLAFLTFVS